MDKKKISKDLELFQETKLNEINTNLSFTILLVQPEHAGNIGSMARVMKNFNFDSLVIFNPKEDVDLIKNYETQGFAMHGKDILVNAEIITIENQDEYITEFKKFIDNFDLVIATTAKGRHYRNIKRVAIFPEDLTIPMSEKPLNIAILFGKESRGLTNDEIVLADVVLRIPTGEYAALNLSHAGGIVLYEIFKKTHKINIGRGKHPVLLADKEDRTLLYKFIMDIIEKVKIRNYKKENAINAFKNVFERAFMSKKELGLITGLFSKLYSIIKDLDLYED